MSWIAVFLTAVLFVVILMALFGGGTVDAEGTAAEESVGDKQVGNASTPEPEPAAPPALDRAPRPVPAPVEDEVPTVAPAASPLSNSMAPTPQGGLQRGMVPPTEDEEDDEDLETVQASPEEIARIRAEMAARMETQDSD